MMNMNAVSEEEVVMEEEEEEEEVVMEEEEELVVTLTKLEVVTGGADVIECTHECLQYQPKPCDQC